MKAGVYIITCLVNRNVYVGSSKNYKTRLSNHFSRLRAGVHANPKLQASFDKYGAERFNSCVLLICKPENLLWFEQRAINVLRPSFNIAKHADAPNRGRVFSAEVRAKVSARLKGNTYTLGYKASAETKAKLSALRRGKKLPARGALSIEHRAIISQTHKGRKHSTIHRARVSEAKRKWWADKKAAACAS